MTSDEATTVLNARPESRKAAAWPHFTPSGWCAARTRMWHYVPPNSHRTATTVAT